MNHTPGPWTIKKYREGPIFIGAPSLPYVAVAVNTEAETEPSDEATANAHLIAAAPLLLEAAETSLQLFEEYSIEEEHPQKIADLRAAINAAKGNQ